MEIVELFEPITMSTNAVHPVAKIRVVHPRRFRDQVEDVERRGVVHRHLAVGIQAEHLAVVVGEVGEAGAEGGGLLHLGPGRVSRAAEKHARFPHQHRVGTS